ncbi:MarR family transcriptional regulator [Rhodopseudomonas boonkerdii]|uniref:MarR family winged helix-turn-helix transcriptional regulator n=1 Tax=Rhodopseudomonas boonkerdii TaxID=475937 RepID=UPI001E3075DE|nr:MarR family transcriptional regulator [Rhodopseudomonas boonkerdii]UGV24210.1 MarR family transcriptional regulator [Rhodopseudomonas boonkerdii]
MLRFMSNDSIDQIIAGWLRRRPDLDAGHLDVVGRIMRLSVHMRSAIEPALQEQGFNWELFDLLLTIYRREAESSSGVRPTDLYAECLLSSGGLTARLRRAEQDGFIIRRQDPDDGRGARITLTAKGRSAVDKAIARHFKLSRSVDAVLTDSERKTLTRLLRKLLVSNERSEP